MVRLLPRVPSLRKSLRRSFSSSKSAEARSMQENEAKAEFAERLGSLLDRPEPSEFACGCCATVNRLEHTERANSHCLFSGLELRRFRCGGCGAVFGPVPLIQCSSEELGGLYALLYRFYREGASQPFQEKTFYLMNPSTRGEYLNYACGDWTVGVERLRSLGWHVWGFEPFQHVASEAIVTSSKKLGNKQYDGLMSHNYIEHVQDPTAFFEDCGRLIMSGGKMAHSSACFDYVYEVSPFHLYFYCGESVPRLASRTGFSFVAEYRADQEYPGFQYVCCLLEKTRV
ncbi:MAG: hypothetical protein ABI557_17990 [Aureliella sp.]